MTLTKGTFCKIESKEWLAELNDLLARKGWRKLYEREWELGYDFFFWTPSTWLAYDFELRKAESILENYYDSSLKKVSFDNLKKFISELP